MVSYAYGQLFCNLRGLGVCQDITGHRVTRNQIEKNEMEMGDPSLFPMNRSEEGVSVRR